MEDSTVAIAEDDGRYGECFGMLGRVPVLIVSVEALVGWVEGVPRLPTMRLAERVLGASERSFLVLADCPQKQDGGNKGFQTLQRMVVGSEKYAIEPADEFGRVGGKWNHR